jgi:prepilin-type N-terminal cleavage/methylation domain-containing protein
MCNIKRRGGFSLIEIIVTMTIMAILLSFTAPSVLRTMEQSHADMAGAGLRMVNTAQRFYWLENRTYAPDMQTLIDANLIDSDLNLTAPRYEFDITAADADGFQARARRRQFDALNQPVYNGAWQGNFTIDETGTIVGNVQGNASSIDGTVPVLTPAF